MESILEFIKTDLFLIILSVIIIVMFILYIINLIELGKIRREYKKFMEKIGKGNNIEEILDKHIEKINKTIVKNEELEKFCIKLDTDIKTCIQKVGIYKYNAYKDVGSELSFTLALLNEKNDGVVINGIYSRDMSNIYAKPVEKGSSPYKMTEEEKEAVKRAIG